MKATLHHVLTPPATARLLTGWGAVLVLQLVGDLLLPPVPAGLLVTALVLIVGVILVAAGGVVHQAERLADRLGDPFGSLVFTLSIVVIEVVLICAVMLGPGEHATIARDSVMAVSMIILDLVIGVCLLVGGLRHGHLEHHRTGVSVYLCLLTVLGALAFALPAAIGTDGAYRTWQQIPVIALTIGTYAFFLVRQTGPQAADFTEVDPRFRPEPAAAAKETERGGSPTGPHCEVPARLAILVATALPVVLLSHEMAALLDDGLGRLGAPPALAGVLIAAIVFLPESITAVRAARAGQVQRVSNLCHGALVSTLGLTIPAVLVIGLLTGQPVVLAESPLNLMLLGLSLLLSALTFAAPRVTAVHGAVHLVLFSAYVLTLFS